MWYRFSGLKFYVFFVVSMHDTTVHYFLAGGKPDHLGPPKIVCIERKHKISLLINISSAGNSYKR
jgi:hypothetical protein